MDAASLEVDGSESLAGRPDASVLRSFAAANAADAKVLWSTSAAEAEVGNVLVAEYCMVRSWESSWLADAV